MTQASKTTDAAGPWVVGVDLGGTNIRLALYRDLVGERRRAAQATDAERAAAEVIDPVLTHREPVGSARSPEALAERIKHEVDRMLARAIEQGEPIDPERAVIPVGIGIAAMLRGHDGEVANAPNLAWRDEPFGHILRAQLGARHPVGLYNDVNAITYGEYAFGAGIGATDVLGVFFGTGIGGGVVAARQLVEGGSNCAGEIGHIKVAFGPDAPLCGCGGRGCIEAFAGGRNLQARLRAELSAGTKSTILALAGDAEFVTPGHLDDAAGDGDAYAVAVHDQLVPLVASTLSGAIFLLNPDRLILGGGLLMRAPVLRQRIIAAIPSYLTQAQLDILEVVDTKLDEEAGILGSALLASERLGEARA
ncbi:MAG: ROK family protein [Haliangiales bacterium]